MAKSPDDDLFKDTTMTFGEHLDELRRCLFKALIGLVVGFLIGLIFGKQIVALITSPMEGALESFYTDRVLGSLETTLRERGVAEDVIQRRLDRANYIILQDEMLFDLVYFDADDVWDDFTVRYPDAAAGTQLSAGASQRYESIDELADDLKAAYANTLAGATLELPDAGEGRTYASDQEMLDALRAANPGVLGQITLPPRKRDLIGMSLWHKMSEDERIRLSTLNAHEGFMIYVKASLLAGALLSSPWIFYQIWSFVAAGLYPQEKKYVHIFLPFSLGLFLIGFAFAFLLVFQPVLDFLLGFNEMLGVSIEPRISEWLSFVLFLPLGFGIAFQLPLVMLFLERIGIFTVQTYIEKWRISIFVISFLSMILTPADPTSMLLMAAPLSLLYFLAILLCKYFPKRRSPLAEA